MPRVLLFVPCERVIFGIGDQSASLIVIINNLQFHTETIPINAIALSRFSVFSHWYRSPGDEGKAFEQKVALSYMNEDPVLENITPFQMLMQLHRLVVNFAKFPALKIGEYNLTLSIREQGESQWPQPVANYPINVTHVPQLQPQIQ
jgi:hypothetical protein